MGRSVLEPVTLTRMRSVESPQPLPIDPPPSEPLPLPEEPLPEEPGFFPPRTWQPANHAEPATRMTTRASGLCHQVNHLSNSGGSLPAPATPCPEAARSD